MVTKARRTKSPTSERGGAFAHGEAFDLLAIDHQRVVLRDRWIGFLARDGAGISALRGIVFEEVSKIVGGDEVVDRDDFDFFAEESLFRDGAKDEPSDSSKAVDADFCHNVSCGLLAKNGVRVSG